jgi:ABC-type cobalamin/Fe3+-siderophores transport system ATPase subunit
MTTHDLTLAAEADQLALLGPEGFVAHGPPAQILHDDAAWARLDLSVPKWAKPPRQPMAKEVRP